MNTSIIDELSSNGIYKYGSRELNAFEANLTKYFTREYIRYKGKEFNPVNIKQGPLALAPEELAEHHYDEGIPFFQNFLDTETMSYTMAFFDNDPDAAMQSKKSLAQAQLDKFGLITERMGIQGNEKVLNLGCGFAFFESFLLEKFPDIQVSGLTHSKDQYDFVMNRMQDPGDILSSGRFHLYYGEIDENTSSILGKQAYDLVCSVGLLEQINNIGLLFAIICELLVENGRMFHHLIVSRDLIPQLLDPQKTLIGDYFPGGKVLPYTTFQQQFDNLKLHQSWFINGINYWKTLDKWHKNFWENIHNIYPGTMDAERVKFWNNYFVLCKAMFLPENGKAYGNGQYLFYKKSAS
jgi:cyclopropane-fatty-acyl-phospholipid synthase